MTESDPTAEIERLQRLWAGEFGDAYVDRNADTGAKREPFWRALLTEFPVQNVLEVGCNTGNNLRWVAQMLPPKRVFGIDINRKALRQIRITIPGIQAIDAAADNLPFDDGQFDLVFTAGVLIHQPVDALRTVMSEILRCSRRYVLCAEYYAPDLVEVSYRGQHGALFKQDYGAVYQQLAPDLALRKHGFLSGEEGWDDVTYWLFERQTR